MKRIFCLIIAAVMVLSVCPALAEGDAEVMLYSDNAPDTLLLASYKDGYDGWKNNSKSYQYMSVKADDFSDGKDLAYFNVQKTGDAWAEYFFENQDLTAYKGLYMWIYSPEMSESKFRIYFVDAEKNETDGMWQAYYSAGSLDFEGWKLIYIPLNSFSRKRSALWSRIASMRIAQAGDNISAVVGTQFYLSEMWLSSKEPSDNMVLTTQSVENGSDLVWKDDVFTFEFSSEPIINEISSVCMKKGIESIDTDWTAENGILTIKPTAELETGASYTLSITDIYSGAGVKAEDISIAFTVNGEVLSNINNSKTISEFALQIDGYQSVLGLDTDDYTDTGKYGKVMDFAYSKLPYSSLAVIKDTVNTYNGIMTDMYNLTADNMSSFLESYKYIIFGNDSASYQKYIGLNSEKRQMVNVIMSDSAPYDDIDSFAAVFVNVMSSFAESGNLASDDNTLVIGDFTQGIGSWQNSSASKNLTVDTPDFANGFSLGHYKVTQAGDKYAYYKFDDYDLSQYQGFYIWMYNPVAIDTSFVVYCVDADKSETDGMWMNYHKLIPLDFQGWKLIYVPLNQMTKIRDASWSNIEFFYLQQSGNGANAIIGSEFYFYKIWFSKKSDATNMKLVNSSICDGDTSVLINEKFTFEFTEKPIINPINSVSLIRNSDGEKTDVELSVSGNTLTVTPVCDLDASEKYTLTLSNIAPHCTEDIKMSFTTVKNDIICTYPMFSCDTLPESGYVAASSEITNLSQETAQAVYVLTAYDESGKMMAVSQTAYEIEPNQTAYALQSLNLKSYDGITVKAFVLNAADSMKPIGKYVGILKDENAYEEPAYDSFETDENYSDGNFKIVSSELNTDNLTVKAKSKDGKRVPVCVSIYNPDSALHGIYYCNTGNDGCLTFETSFDADADLSGRYTVKLSAAGMTNLSPVWDSVFFLNNADRDLIVKQINQLSSAQAVAAFLNQNKTELSIGNVDYTADKNLYISESLCKNIPFSSYDEIIKCYHSSVTALALLNEGDWVKYEKTLEEYKNVIFVSSECERKYTELSASMKGKVLQSVCAYAPFYSFTRFNNLLSDIIADLSEKTSGASSGSGTSSGGAQKSNSYTWNGTGSSSLPVSPEEIKYTDIPDSHWAYSYIYKLLNAGVLTMNQTRTFRPEDDVTREEFVKMIVTALHLPDDKTGEFTDVSDSDWFAEYVNAAYSAGIIAGNDDGTFGAGKLITRQDMAVMVYRAVKEKLSDNKTDFLFTDDSAISDYARDAIYAMYQNGIINGIGSGVFEPNGNATRAQAAKLIAFIMAI